MILPDRRQRRKNSREAQKVAESLGIAPAELELWLALTDRYMEQFGYDPRQAATRAAETILISRPGDEEGHRLWTPDAAS